MRVFRAVSVPLAVFPKLLILFSELGTGIMITIHMLQRMARESSLQMMGMVIEGVQL